MFVGVFTLDCKGSIQNQITSVPTSMLDRAMRNRLRECIPRKGRLLCIFFPWSKEVSILNYLLYLNRTYLFKVLILHSIDALCLLINA